MNHELRDVKLRAASGLEVELTVKRPIASTTRPEATSALHRARRTRRGRAAVPFHPRRRGMIVAALSYPTRESPARMRSIFVKHSEHPAGVSSIHRPPSCSRWTTWMQPDVDPTWIEAVGVSLGGPFVTIAAALDERISRVWVVHGSAGSYGPLEVSMRREIPVPGVRHAAAALSALIINPSMAPERWAHRVAPRPFMMVNARSDERMPRKAVQRLFDGAREPKALVWLPGGHVRSNAAVRSRSSTPSSR